MKKKENSLRSTTAIVSAKTAWHLSSNRCVTTTSMTPIYFNWSTGKDSSLALYHLLRDKNFAVTRLLTSVNAYHNRVSMHGLRRELLQQQVAAIGIPCTTIELPEQPGMQEYENLMRETVTQLKAEGYNDAAFGDIFLQDLRVYREKQLQQFDIKAHFPLWKRDTKELLNEFLDLGFKAILVCTSAGLLDASFCGRIIDKDFIADLPGHVDPCGENGEFHTFCFDGPIFMHPIAFTKGEVIYREYKDPSSNGGMGFWFCDIMAGEAKAPRIR